MENLYISVFVLLIGISVVLCTKSAYKGKMAAFFVLLSFITGLFPIFSCLGAGSAAELPLNRFLFSQEIRLTMDPLSAFTYALLAAPCICYACSVIFRKDYVIKKWLAEFMLIFALLSVFALNVQNCIPFYISCVFMGAALICLIILRTGNFKILKIGLVYLAAVSLAVAIMLSGMYSHSFVFSEIVKSYTVNEKCYVFG